MDKTFAKEVEEGLSAEKKYLSSLYFYDDNGSRIFQEIMAMPEYYLTDSEFEILQMQGKDIYNALGFDEHFNIIELGAGDGLKTKELIGNLLEVNADFTYIPIDISQEALDFLVQSMENTFPNLGIKPQVGDYFEMMDKVEAEDKSPNLVIFLGANIGNFKNEWALDLMKHINEHMRVNDKLLVGFDLQKNPSIIRNAYDDPHGITKRFNLNLLLRINNELEADFQLDQFDFYSYYDPNSGDVKSYLISLKEQDVNIGAVNKSFHFEKDELVSTELSKKYTLSEIEHLGLNAGFKFEHHFLDCKHYFSDTLFIKQ